MPEYLAPGVFVEETSFRAKSIEGVSTTTTGFIGPARFGPVHLEPDIVTSLGEFEQVYGSGELLAFSDFASAPNFLWQAVRAFFTEGGKRLYVSRVFRPLQGDYVPIAADDELQTPINLGSSSVPRYADGLARVAFSRTGDIAIRARHPGAVGNLRVKLTLKGRPNVLGSTAGLVPGSRVTTLGALADKDLVWIRDVTSPSTQHDSGAFYVAHWNEDDAIWQFESPASGSPSLAGTLRSVAELFNGVEPNSGDAVRVVTLSVTLQSRDGRRGLASWPDLPLDPRHRSGGSGDSVFDKFANTPGSSADARLLPLVIARSSSGVTSAFDVLSALFGGDPVALLEPDATEQARAIEPADKLGIGVSVNDLPLDGGNDGMRPQAAQYEGEADPRKSYSLGLEQFAQIEDISIVAAPGVTWQYSAFADQANGVTSLLIAHAERMRYRIAVLDSAEGQTIADVRNMRAKIDSRHAALYYPWVRVLDPITRNEIYLPPSGFVAGIYARSDNERGVIKAPANEVVRLALGFETLLSKGQQEVLNPEGINCFRYFEGRGMWLWGARTISSDPEWKYVNIRRYFAYLERSIDKGIQWAVFEPNGEQLWANVRRTIEDFLLNEWQGGALLGDKPDKAFFVRCDRSTMTQNDLDNGRLICLIGVAPLKPAEFVILRIGQWTADRKS
jgi:phage tail sheath protein FI